MDIRHYRGHQVRIILNPEEDITDAFIAYVPNLPSCGGYGATAGEALERAGESIDRALGPRRRQKVTKEGNR